MPFRSSRIVSGLVVVIIMAALMGVLATPACAQSNDYPFASWIADTPDPYLFDALECTSFVAWRMNRDAGTTDQTHPWFTNHMQGGLWGSAYQWWQNAQTLGYTVDYTPTVGAIAQWYLNECSGLCGTKGHVAYVESVNADNSVNLSEYNFCTPYGFDIRTTVDCNGNGGGIHPPRFLHIVSAHPVTVTNFFQANSNGQYTINCPTDNLVDSQFQLLNSFSSSVFFSQVALAIHRESDDSFLADVAIQSNVTIPGGATYQFPRSFLDGTNPNLVPGSYRLVAKIYNGAWIELALHLPFTILGRNNNCGSTSTNPLVTTLSNTTQSVQWFYFYNPSNSGWYIVSASGGSVLYLAGVSTTFSGGIVWEPINNYQAYANYPAAGQNFSYINVAADGRSVSFGNANGAMLNNPLVASLANTTQSVQWFYFYNPSNSGWYIVSASGGSVLYLAGVSTTFSGGIVWEPINNYQAYANYPAAGQNFSSVAISSDGRSVSFGPLQ